MSVPANIVTGLKRIIAAGKIAIIERYRGCGF